MDRQWRKEEFELSEWLGSHSKPDDHLYFILRSITRERTESGETSIYDKLVQIFQGYQAASQSTSSGISTNDPNIDREELLTEKLKNANIRNSFLISTIGYDQIVERLSGLFPERLVKCTWRLLYNESKEVSVEDYSILFRALDNLSKLLLTIVRPDYFIARWLEGKPPVFRQEDLLYVLKISKQSPGEVIGSGIAIVAESLGKVLTVGEQIKSYKLAKIEAEKAQIELEEKKLALEKLKKEQEVRGSKYELEIELREIDLKSQIEELKTKKEEAVIKRRKLQLEDLENRFTLLAKAHKILSEIPRDMQESFKALLFAELDTLEKIPLLIEAIEADQEKDPTTISL